MPGPIPLLNFQAYNPMNTALSSALGVYGGLGEGKSRSIQNQLNQAKVPYAADIARYEAENAALIPQKSQAELDQLRMVAQMYPELTNAQMSNIQSEINKRNQEISRERMLMDYLKGAMGQGNQIEAASGMPAGKNLPMNMDVAQPFATGTPNDMASQYFRKALGLPMQTPQEKMAYDLSLDQQKKIFGKQLEKSQGTTGYLSQAQTQAQGIKNAIPIIDDLIDTAPGQLAEWTIHPDRQATYNSQIANLKEKIMTAFAYPKNEASFETVKNIIEYKPTESLENYRSRMEALKQELETIYGDISDKNLETKETNYSKEKSISLEEGAKKLGYKKVNGKWIKG